MSDSYNNEKNDKNIDLQTGLIINDFAKAFNKVPHKSKRIIYKMKYWNYGFSQHFYQTVENTTSEKKYP